MVGIGGFRVKRRIEAGPGDIYSTEYQSSGLKLFRVVVGHGNFGGYYLRFDTSAVLDLNRVRTWYLEK